MPARNFPSIELVRQALRYENGKLFWKERPVSHFKSEKACKRFNTYYPDTEACSLNFSRGECRYRTHLFGLNLYRQTIVWALHHGVWCIGLDHKNRNTLDDRISNLRIATRIQNGYNSGIYKNNTSGYKGVSWHKSKKMYGATITVDRKQIHLGYFATSVKAYAAYVKAAKKYHGKFFCSG